MITKEEFGQWIETQTFKEKFYKFVQENQFEFEDYASFTADNWIDKLGSAGSAIYIQLNPKKTPLELLLNEFSAEIKTDFSVVDKLANNVFEEVVDRDVCMRGMANEILRRWLLRDSELDRKDIDRYIGLQAPSGGGKSKMMDYTGQIKGDIMDHADVAEVYMDVRSQLQLGGELTTDMREILNGEVAKLKKMMNESVYIPITFGGNTEVWRSEDPEQAISIRILHSYFIDKTKLSQSLSSDSFYSRLGRVGKFSIDASLAIIREHSKKESIFLLFDEIAKKGNAEQVTNCLRCVSPMMSKSLRDCCSRNHVIISSLEVSSITKCASEAGRHIHFVPLNRLSVEASLGLFWEYTKFAYVTHLIVTVGGHPRCLEALFGILKQYSNELGVWNYEMLFNKLLSGAAEHAIFYAYLCIEDVRAALLRTTVPMDDEVARYRTYEDSVQRALYLNSFSDEEIKSRSFVPIISPFALAIFASGLLLTEYKGSLLHRIGETLYKLTEFGSTFEIAHGLWETLIRLLYQSKHSSQSCSNLQLTSIYPKYLSSTLVDEMYFVVPGDTFLFYSTKKQFNDMKQDQFQPNVIYHFESSNDGFNLACYPEAGDTQGPGKVTWNIATRCITYDTTTDELITSVARQMTLTLDQYGGTQFSDRQSYLVVALKGDIGANFVGSQVPKNCIVLTSEHLAACYGKSLVDYMLFLD